MRLIGAATEELAPHGQGQGPRPPAGSLQVRGCRCRPVRLLQGKAVRAHRLGLELPWADLPGCCPAAAAVELPHLPPPTTSSHLSAIATRSVPPSPPSAPVVTSTGAAGMLVSCFRPPCPPRLQVAVTPALLPKVHGHHTHMHTHTRAHAHRHAHTISNVPPNRLLTTTHQSSGRLAQRRPPRQPADI